MTNFLLGLLLGVVIGAGVLPVKGCVRESAAKVRESVR